MGGDVSVAFTWDIPVAVSIHAPAWGATKSGARADVVVRVSIHAPAWGATQILAQRFVVHHVSIHAPAWGATPKTMADARILLFQSTPPHGGRLRSFFSIK